MTTRLFILCVGAVVAASSAAAIAQVMIPVPADAPKVVYLVQPGLPETVVVKPTLEDRARVCVEPARGTLACRTVAEFRAWVQQR